MKRENSSTPTPLEIFLTVKVLLIPPPEDMEITTPSNVCTRERFPSITFTPTETVSPDWTL